ncbi:succinate dehydrogenase/fumarate reductase cytochrome b subunit [Malaciobacter mytili LMG 24559]|uniref:Fumarate reductase cytochrome b subunit n=1 Tax=Malaciobacter mytili LMG 24559 TaxID=1032238 RepID=A0AAX2AHT2_9BACT|nr:fumarate reductase cytochrome b subunit [Malaciobacter mytili]AXH16060.1 fumarate reductase, cytochrome b subunit [Malaciobacter mytili LMG 24559]RXK15756.1 succinate dehydrogenase/fumarate reductase cytochrome b subunit [Malaciobacter mytili LMG 24559]
MENVIEAYTGVTTQGKKSRTPAKLDMWLTGTGVFLALFMMGHMLFVSTILLGKDVMYKVTKLFELEFLFEGGIPAIVSVLVFAISAIFIIHAILGVRKFPISYKSYLKINEHSKMMKHSDTSMWMFQWISGLVMMFAAMIHLFIMFTQPQNIGPFASAYRVVENHMWLLYVVLLICVEIHGSVGLYRAAMKWGWFDGENPKETRAKLLKVKKILSFVFLTLGVVTLLAYIKIGLENDIAPGQKYKPEVTSLHTIEK